MHQRTLRRTALSGQTGVVRAGLLVALTALGATTANDCQEPPTEDNTVCYPGADEGYGTCYTLDPMSVPPPSGYEYPATCEPSYGPQYQTPTYLLDLTTTDPDDYLAPNFQLWELAQEWKGQYAVLQVHAVESLQAVRDRVGPLNINSGYRSPDYNASVDGATCSRHMYGDAFDMYASYASLEELADACYAEGADFVKVYDTWVHCDWRYAPLDDAYYGTGARDDLTASRIDLPESEAYLVAQDGRWTAPAVGWDEGEPLRQWTAYDGKGHVLLEATGSSFVPPPGTRHLTVVVGLEITLQTDIPSN